MTAQIIPTHLYWGYSLATYSYATQSELIQNTATNTKFNKIFLHIWPVFFYYSIIFSFVFWTNKLQYIYNQDQMLIQKAVQWDAKDGESVKLVNYRRQSWIFKLWKHCVYGKPIWNTGAARRSRPLRRDFPREVDAAKADAKLGSSTKERLGGLAGGLETSNRPGNFNGLRVTFLFRLPEGDWIRLGPGRPRAGGASGTYSTRPSSTTSDILTPGLDAVSLRGVPPWYQRSLVSLAERRRNTTQSQHAHISAMTWLAEADATTLHGA